jgi:hypothetical protein
VKNKGEEMQQEKKVMLTKRGKEMSRASMLSGCANRALSKLKSKYYAEFRSLYEQELASVGIEFSFENQKLMQRENSRLKELLKENGIQA